MAQLVNVLRARSAWSAHARNKSLSRNYEPGSAVGFPGITGRAGERAERFTMHLNTRYDRATSQLFRGGQILWMTLGVVIRGKGAY
jgi:hypothetical protein